MRTLAPFAFALSLLAPAFGCSASSSGPAASETDAASDGATSGGSSGSSGGSTSSGGSGSSSGGGSSDASSSSGSGSSSGPSGSVRSIGDPCTSDSQCPGVTAGGGMCMTSWPGGACTIVACGVNCPGNSQCNIYMGQSYCTPDCEPNLIPCTRFGYACIGGGCFPAGDAGASADGG